MHTGIALNARKPTTQRMNGLEKEREWRVKSSLNRHRHSQSPLSCQPNETHTKIYKKLKMFSSTFARTSMLTKKKKDKSHLGSRPKLDTKTKPMRLFSACKIFVMLSFKKWLLFLLGIEDCSSFVK